MARAARSRALSARPTAIAHTFLRGIRRERIFLTEDDAYEFLERATDAFARFDVKCRAYCLMPTHYHFVLEGGQPDVSAAMHRLNGGYAKWFNRTHAFRGHLFGDRYGARAVESEAHFLEVVRYVVLNPVRANLCSAPAEWRWSSYAATIGAKLGPELLDLEWMRGLVTPDGFAKHVAAGTVAIPAAA